MTDQSKNSNPRVRVQFSFAINNIALKAVLSATVPLVLSWVPQPPIQHHWDCHPQIVQPSNADIACSSKGESLKL